VRLVLASVAALADAAPAVPPAPSAGADGAGPGAGDGAVGLGSPDGGMEASAAAAAALRRAEVAADAVPPGAPFIYAAKVRMPQASHNYEGEEREGAVGSPEKVA